MASAGSGVELSAAVVVHMVQLIIFQQCVMRLVHTTTQGGHSTCISQLLTHIVGDFKRFLLPDHLDTVPRGRPMNLSSEGWQFWKLAGKVYQLDTKFWSLCGQVD